MVETIIHEHRNIENHPDLKVELTRGQKGGYGWTITYSGKTNLGVFQTIRDMDESLRQQYGEASA